VIHEDSEGRCPECSLEINWTDICNGAIENNRDRFKHLWYTEVAKLPLDELRCIKCEYRVHGLTKNRCPECGEPFDWDTVYDAAISKQANLFEYRWFADPLNSLARTFWLGAARPFKLWAAYNKSTTPRVGPLLALICIQWLIFARGWHAVARGIDPLMNFFARQLTGPRGLRFTYNPHFTNADLVDYAAWSLTTFLVLLMFVQSNREYRVSWRHLLRVFAHATIFASLCTAAWCVAEALLDSTNFLRQWPPPASSRYFGIPRIYYEYLGNSAMYLALASIWAGLWIGYSRYLRIPHGWAISAVAILVGSLTSQSLRVFILNS